MGFFLEERYYIIYTWLNNIRMGPARARGGVVSRRNRRGVIATGRYSQNGTILLSFLFGGADLPYGNRSQGLQSEEDRSQKGDF
jgi:hypothetical protein